MGKYYGVTTGKLRQYVKEAHNSGDRSAVKQLYADYKRSGGKLPLSRITGPTKKKKGRR
jgi:hypothetical protein